MQPKNTARRIATNLLLVPEERLLPNLLTPREAIEPKDSERLIIVPQYLHLNDPSEKNTTSTEPQFGHLFIFEIACCKFFCHH